MVTRRIAEGYSAWVALAKQLQLLQLSQSDDRKCLWVTVTRSTVQSCRVGYGCHRQHRHFQWDDLEEGKYFTTKTTLLTRLPIVTRSTKLPPPTGLTALLWGTKVPVVANGATVSHRPSINRGRIVVPHGLQFYCQYLVLLLLLGKKRETACSGEN